MGGKYDKKKPASPTTQPSPATSNKNFARPSMSNSPGKNDSNSAAGTNNVAKDETHDSFAIDPKQAIKDGNESETTIQAEVPKNLGNAAWSTPDVRSFTGSVDMIEFKPELSNMTSKQTTADTKNHTDKQTQVNLNAPIPFNGKPTITKESISQLQKDTATSFHTALVALLRKYIPSALFSPHPSIPPSQRNENTPSILEIEVRHAIAHAARNVYHAHIHDEKSRVRFDNAYAELQDEYFGKGARVAGAMRKLAKVEKMGKKGAEDGIANEEREKLVGDDDREFGKEI